MKLSTLALAGLLLAAAPLPSLRAQASVVGQWGPVKLLPWSPIHSLVLPTDEVLLYQLGNLVGAYEPISDTWTQLANFSFNPLCNGHAQLADGRFLLAGGHIANNVGLPNTTIYDPVTNTMTDQPAMSAGRWYPTLVTLANGDVLTLSGDIQVGQVQPVPEVFEAATGTWRELTDAPLDLALYPASFLAPNGRVFVATQISSMLDTSGTGSWSGAIAHQAFGRDNYGSACMYDEGRVIYTGGADPPLASCETIDLAAGQPGWSYVAPMPQKRRQQNTTLLPDGRVLVTGGSSSAGFDTDDGPKPAIVWDPATNTWTTWATEALYRGNHAQAVLLPDGRVMSVGGDTTSSLQIFSPPYLFAGPRPTITSAPGTVCHGQTFFIATPDAADIAQVNWLRPAAVTHTKNMNQRINRLSFSVVPGGLNVTAPATAALCPPGDQMLFLINSSGVPSVAHWIRAALEGGVEYCTAGTSASGCSASLSATGAASASAPSGFQLTASDVEGAKDGLFFFSSNGRGANPWGNSTSFQCVTPPVRRAGLLQGNGGSGSCDGSFTQDLNALWCPSCPGSPKNPGAGALVQAQLWYRDPFSTSNQSTALSDALEFCVGP